MSTLLWYISLFMFGACWKQDKNRGSMCVSQKMIKMEGVKVQLLPKLIRLKKKNDLGNVVPLTLFSRKFFSYWGSSTNSTNHWSVSSCVQLWTATNVKRRYFAQARLSGTESTGQTQSNKIKSKKITLLASLPFSSCAHQNEDYRKIISE